MVNSMDTENSFIRMFFNSIFNPSNHDMLKLENEPNYNRQSFKFMWLGKQLNID
jgi:hypothetical protein